MMRGATDIVGARETYPQGGRRGVSTLGAGCVAEVDRWHVGPSACRCWDFFAI